MTTTISPHHHHHHHHHHLIIYSSIYQSINHHSIYPLLIYYLFISGLIIITITITITIIIIIIILIIIGNGAVECRWLQMMWLLMWYKITKTASQPVDLLQTTWLDIVSFNWGVYIEWGCCITDRWVAVLIASLRDVMDLDSDVVDAKFLTNWMSAT